jgi:hypothetical protein
LDEPVARSAWDDAMANPENKSVFIVVALKVFLKAAWMQREDAERGIAHAPERTLRLNL